MKLKKRSKSNKTKNRVDQVYPEENNPFKEIDEDITMTSENHNTRKKTTSEKGNQKKIYKKEKKEKKTQPKLKNIGKKRERAISNALLDQQNNEKQTFLEIKNITNVQQEQEVFRNNASVHQNAESQQQNGNLNHKHLKATLQNKCSERIVQHNPSPTSPNMHGHKDHHTTKKMQKIKRPSEGDIKALKIHRKNKETGELKNDFDVDIKEKTKQLEQNSKKSSKIEVLPSARDRAPSRRGRTSSVVVSSRERKKKKRIRILRRLKRKDKTKTAHPVELNDDLKLFNPKPKKPSSTDDVANLQENVTEVKDIIANKVIESLDKRHSNLSQIMDTTEQLESFAGSFAELTHKVKIKEETKGKCCGIFSKYRICWYICTCSTGVKRKSKKATYQAPSQSRVTSRAFADQLDDTNEPYEVREKLLGCEYSNVRLRKHRTGKPQSTVNSHCRDSKTSRSSGTSLLTGIQNLNLLKSINRASNGTLGKKERNERSSTEDLETLLARKTNVPDVVKLEIESAISEYGDQDDRKRAAELLLMDHEN